MHSRGNYGLGAFGGTTYGGAPDDTFRVLTCESLNQHRLVVGFNQDINFSFPLVLESSNYTIPGLVVTSVEPYGSTSVLIGTSEQTYQSYLLTVGFAQSLLGLSLDPLHRTVGFTGIGPNPGFFAVALTETRVRLLFSEPLLETPDLTNPACYAVQGQDGSYNRVVAVTTEQLTGVRSLVLTLEDALTTTAWYQVRLSPVIHTATGLNLVPPSKTFQYIDTPASVSVSLDRFTGEVRGGLWGTPAGLVFFGPAVDAPLANSVIEVDHVSVCTVAYDTYSAPTFDDPSALYTWQPGVPNTTIGSSGVVLWGAFPRLSEARFGFAQKVEDTYGGAETGPATATLTEVWDPTYVSLLDNPYWTLSWPSGGVEFKTANSLGPIPPGSVTTVTLET